EIDRPRFRFVGRPENAPTGSVAVGHLPKLDTRAACEWADESPVGTEHCGNPGAIPRDQQPAGQGVPNAEGLVPPRAGEQVTVAAIRHLPWDACLSHAALLQASYG